MNQLIKSKYSWSREHREYRQATNTQAYYPETIYPAMTIIIFTLLFLIIFRFTVIYAVLLIAHIIRKSWPQSVVEINRLTMQIYTNRSTT